MPRIKWIVPFERNSCFTGRESELTRLEKQLYTEGGPKKIAVIGLGGVGKTSLIVELAYRIRKDHEDCSVFWIPAMNFESLQQAYLNICQQLRLSGWDNKNEDPKRLLQHYLSQDSAGQWLLVFDNADDISMWTGNQVSDRVSHRLIDYLPTSQVGRIVFTSRDRKTAYSLVQRSELIVKVPELSKDVATQLLQKYVPGLDLATHADDVESLLKLLTYLPLAIVQAASYINQNDESLATYISLLADQEDEVLDLLSEHFEDDSRYREAKNPIAMTWLISFEQIRVRDPLAAELLSFIACLDSKDVPLSLLPPGLSRKEEINALGTLDAYAFVYKRQADSSLDVHRLVHLATRGWLRREGLFLDRNLDTSQPSGPRDPAPPLLRRLRPGSTSAQVCSGLLTHLIRNRQLLTRSPKRPPFPARGPNLFPLYAHSQTVILVCLSSCVGPFLPSGCFTPSSAFCLGLCIL
jgi:hypothetical protein